MTARGKFQSPFSKQSNKVKKDRQDALIRKEKELKVKGEFIYSSTVPVSGPSPEVWDYEIINIDHLRSVTKYWVVNDALIREEIAVTKDQTDIPGIRVFKR